MSAADVAEALEEAAKRIERRAGNDLYRRAWKRAACIVRDLRDEKLTLAAKELTDNAKQISSPSSRPV